MISLIITVIIPLVYFIWEHLDKLEIVLTVLKKLWKISKPIRQWAWKKIKSIIARWRR